MHELRAGPRGGGDRQQGERQTRHEPRATDTPDVRSSCHRPMLGPMTFGETVTSAALSDP